MAIREVLNEAFERLRGPGVRSYSESDWLLYNILYYRYFKHHMKNEHIAARLGIPNMRQYYRHRNKAIKAVLDILFEMEKGYNSDK